MIDFEGARALSHTCVLPEVLLGALPLRVDCCSLNQDCCVLTVFPLLLSCWAAICLFCNRQGFSN